MTPCAYGSGELLWLSWLVSMFIVVLLVMATPLSIFKQYSQVLQKLFRVAFIKPFGTSEVKLSSSVEQNCTSNITADECTQPILRECAFLMEPSGQDCDVKTTVTAISLTSQHRYTGRIQNTPMNLKMSIVWDLSVTILGYWGIVLRHSQVNFILLLSEMGFNILTRL